LKELESLFNETIELVYAVFGESAFLATFKNRESSPSRKIVYDSLMQAFSRNLKAKNRIIQNATTIKATRYSNERLLHSKRTNRHIFDGRHGEPKDVEERIKYFQELLQNYIQ
jgi:hypothetical protein